MPSDTSGPQSFTQPDQAPAAARSNGALPLLILFSSALFVSALLLFLVQPMIAKMLLPLFGGTPAVWNTCMVFFQAALLAGYAYAHLITTRLCLRRQIALHLGLLCLAALTLPFSISESFSNAAAIQANPSLWLLRCLAIAAGLPFFIVSATGPLLQKWFSHTAHASARDPYFLYAASNLGSLVALLAYPVLIEPNLRLNEQSEFWTAGFAVFGIFILACALNQRRFLSPEVERLKPRENSPPRDSTIVQSADFKTPSAWQRCRWTALAFVPSTLMLGVTTYLTTDIASIPLLWIMPLSVYLLTFILAFARVVVLPLAWVERALPAAAVGLIYLLVTEATDPVGLLIVLHLLVFFVASLACHGRLAVERPSPEHLTEFYLWISFGGALGGIFSALIAPAVFTRVAEYPIALILACLLRTQTANPSTRAQRLLDLLIPLAIAGLTILAARAITPLPVQWRLAVVFGVPLILSYTTVDRPWRFALALGAVVLSGPFYAGTHGQTLHAERNFFGVLRVTHDPNGAFHRLVHGNTVHGRQFIDPARQADPLSYYHRTGPLGQIVAEFNKRPASPYVAVIGLGAGSMAAYANRGESWTYYEINPAVIRIAQNTNYFTFLENSAAGTMQMVVGDARLRLREAPNRHFGLMVLDAFSSDSIPIHLVTREAMQLYLSKLAPNGLLAFHISNRCLDLEPVVADMARDAGLLCLSQDENDPSAREALAGKDQSHWMVVARSKEDFGRLTRDARWLPAAGRSDAPVWSDDFSDILSVFKWK